MVYGLHYVDNLLYIKTPLSNILLRVINYLSYVFYIKTNLALIYNKDDK